MRGKDLLRRGSIPLEQRYYGNARIFRDDELGFLERRDPDLSHVAVTRELYERTRAAGYDDVTAMQYVDLFTWLRSSSEFAMVILSALTRMSPRSQVKRSTYCMAVTSS